MNVNNGERVHLRNLRNLSHVFLILWNLFPANEFPIDKIFTTTSNTSRNQRVKDTFSLHYLFLYECFAVKSQHSLSSSFWIHKKFSSTRDCKMCVYSFSLIFKMELLVEKQSIISGHCPLKTFLR